jgi:AcrR family transcriptional regulator
MQDPNDLVPPPLTMRTTPVQQRGADRITQLLDAAAALIDENGIDGLTTTDVAARSGSSVGVVYRYFPNIQALLRGLAKRNLEEFSRRTRAAVEEAPARWLAAVDTIVDSYADMMRTVPGFRAVRFGNIIDERFMHAGQSNNTFLANEFADLIVAKYPIDRSDELVFDLEVLVECADALLRRAFLYEREGDERFIERARALPAEFLKRHEVEQQQFA